MDSIRIDAEGLGLRALERPGPGAKVLLLHGWLDHAHGFDFVAGRLPAELHLLALDFRGHGQSAHLPDGALYHFTDFVSDTHAAVEHLGGRAHLVGHSMGGAVAMLYAAAMPEKVSSLFLLETLGPLGGELARLVPRLRAFVLELGKPRRRRRYASVEDAAARLRENNPTLSEAAALHLARHGTRPADGGCEFTFDPLLRRSFGHAYDEEQVLSAAREVRCPVRILRATRGSEYGEAQTRARLEALRSPEVIALEGSHHVHLDRPAEVAKAIADHVASAER